MLLEFKNFTIDVIDYVEEKDDLGSLISHSHKKRLLYVTTFHTI